MALAMKDTRRRSPIASTTRESPRGEPQPEDRNPTALAILDAADALLTEVGYEGLSARAIADRAGVNNALVFYYFGSKQRLVERVLARYYGRHLEALEGAMGREGTLRERFHALVDGYVDFIEANLRYPRLIQHQLVGPDAFREHIQRNLALLFEWTKKTLTGLAPERGPHGARHLFVTISGTVINYYTYGVVLGPMWGGDPLSRAALAERRAHVHWVVDALLAQLERDHAAAPPTPRRARTAKPTGTTSRRRPPARKLAT